MLRVGIRDQEPDLGTPVHTGGRKKHTHYNRHGLPWFTPQDRPSSTGLDGHSPITCSGWESSPRSRGAYGFRRFTQAKRNKAQHPKRTAPKQKQHPTAGRNGKAHQRGSQATKTTTGNGKTHQLSASAYSTAANARPHLPQPKHFNTKSFDVER